MVFFDAALAKGTGPRRHAPGAVFEDVCTPGPRRHAAPAGRF